MPTVHLLSGLIGAGKSTLARRLERELPAMRISLDEWIVTLFGEEMPADLTLEWWSNRAARCSRTAYAVARQASPRAPMWCSTAAHAADTQSRCA